ncbi:MAG TPA: metal-dependent transcriptional regulator, partial [Planctomycetaceae bacterium]|nr:metal-dependent transcriptional regulator [Pirellulales bacterium]HCK71451.1 metal-dependent transcriptional regulator [Planctomycetaceae bacterium]
MATLTIENYVKTIYQLVLDNDGQPAATGQVADALDVSPGTVTSMLKTLSDSGLAAYRPYEGVVLSESGEALALRVLRRHRLIELFLQNTLELTWDEVHDEAENMEHAVSDLLIDRIDDYLGHPETDPHGDPIPKSDGTIAMGSNTSLAELAPGDRFRISRVTRQDAEFLRELSRIGLQLQSTGVVTGKHVTANSIAFFMGETSIELTLDAASEVLVDVEDPTTVSQEDVSV